MPEDTQLNFEQVINAPADLIYRAFTSQVGLREWLCDMSITNPTKEGGIYLVWDQGYFASGKYTAVNPNKVVSFTWIGKDEPGWSQVDVVIVPLDNGAHKIVLRHSGLGDSEAWNEARQNISKGWKLGLDNLKSILEEGLDLRVVNRPMIGFFPYAYDNYTEAEKIKFGFPVDYGVMVSNVVPNYGADKAGLRSDDLIVGIEDQKVDTVKTLLGIIKNFSAGEQISIQAYRGSEKLTFLVDTTPQLTQTLPGSPEELAKEIQADRASLLDSLEKILTGLNDAEASYSPDPEKWSVKETLVHFILHERNLQTWVNDLVSDVACLCDVNPNHSLVRIRATLTSYPTLVDLMAELQRTYKETVALVAFLESSFTQRKASYWRVRFELLDKYLGYQEHIRRMAEMIVSVRREISTS
ncbi:MAG: PDZ domain-containing protein [Chloroflexi bacterium]|nr:PDZ domain-containing protein [Chloroflexota bacterium]